jgi:hypothetical protein
MRPMQLFCCTLLALALAASAAPSARAQEQKGNNNVGVGAVLSSADGGQIYGFDINGNSGGTDGKLNSAAHS